MTWGPSRPRKVAILTLKGIECSIRFETLCRLEKGRHTPSIPTIKRIEQALKTARKESVGSEAARSFSCHWAEAELNRRHTDFQSVALPTELPAR